MIDEATVQDYKKVLQDEFDLGRKQLQSEALVHVEAQTRTVVERASADVEMQRGQLDAEWHQAQAA